MYLIQDFPLEKCESFGTTATEHSRRLITAVSLHCQLAFLPSRFIVVRMLHRYVHVAHVILIKRVLIHVHLDSRFVVIISHASENQRKRTRHCYKACQALGVTLQKL